MTTEQDVEAVLHNGGHELTTVARKALDRIENELKDARMRATFNAKLADQRFQEVVSLEAERDRLRGAENQRWERHNEVRRVMQAAYSEAGKDPEFNRIEQHARDFVKDSARGNDPSLPWEAMTGAFAMCWPDVARLRRIEEAAKVFLAECDAEGDKSGLPFNFALRGAREALRSALSQETVK